MLVQWRRIHLLSFHMISDWANLWYNFASEYLVAKAMICGFCYHVFAEHWRVNDNFLPVRQASANELHRPMDLNFHKGSHMVFRACRPLEYFHVPFNRWWMQWSGGHWPYCSSCTLGFNLLSNISFTFFVHLMRSLEEFCQWLIVVSFFDWVVLHLGSD